MTTDPNADYLWQRRHDIKMRVVTNRLYQLRRSGLFDLREGIVKALSLVAGSVALSRTVPESAVHWCLVVICIGTSASLVFGWGQKSRDAARRATEWATLEQQIEAVGERGFTEEQLNTWAARANEIETTEPSPNHRLLEQCHDRACMVLGGTTPENKRWGKNLPPLIIQ